MNLKLLSALAISAGLAGCSTAPGNSKQQGAVVGGATGAAVGATVTKNKALGAVIGGAVGAAGGYVVGGKTGHLDKKDSDNSTTTAPADSLERAVTTATADANRDGFVTLDEIVAMEKGDVTDDEMIRRIQVTGLTFDLNDEQRKFLSERGVSPYVIDRLPSLNRAAGSAVISK